MKEVLDTLDSHLQVLPGYTCFYFTSKSEGKDSGEKIGNAGCVGLCEKEP